MTREQKQIKKKADAIAIVSLALTVIVSISTVYAERPDQITPAETVCEVMARPTAEEPLAPVQESTATETPVTEAVQPPYSPEDLESLALVIYQEAGGDACSDETRLAVGTVVMNRVADPRFPDTISGVLTQKGQYGRLYWTGLVWADRASKAAEKHAVARAYRCAEKILEGYRSFGADVIWQAEFSQGSEIVAFQDGLYFCR